MRMGEMIFKKTIEINTNQNQIKEWILENSFERKYWMQPAPYNAGKYFSIIKHEDTVFYLEPLSAVNGIKRNVFNPVVVIANGGLRRPVLRS